MTLAVTMIVKNESAVLARALDGAKSIADEIIVVDTGSTDDTRDIARRYTDKVYGRDWNGDFSAARNFALSQVTTDYWLWLDADDIVPERTAKGIARIMKAIDGADIVMLPYIVSVNSAGKPDFSYYRERIVKNRSDYFWRGRVHEAIDLHGKIIYKPFPIFHGKPQNRSAGTRNLDIYNAMLADGDVLSPRELYYYARELFYNGHIQKAEREFAAFIAEPNGFYVNKIDACVLRARCLFSLGNKREARECAASAFVFGPPTAELCCLLGELYFDISDYRTSAFWYKTALAAKPDATSGEFVKTDFSTIVPLIWLAVCYVRLGDTDRAFAYHKRAAKISPTHPSVIANTEYFSKLGYTPERVDKTST